MEGLPQEVIRLGRSYARRTGIDDEDGISFVAEEWAAHTDDPALARTIAFRHCVDEGRHRHGQLSEGKRRPVALLVDPNPDSELSPLLDLMGASEDHGYEDVENRCVLSDLISDLPDADLAALARVYWLGQPFPSSVPAAVATMRGLRRARAVANGTRKAQKGLTKRQVQITALAAQGKTNECIADELDLSPNTVKTTLQNAYKAVGASDRAHLVAMSLRNGWIA